MLITRDLDVKDLESAAKLREAGFGIFSVAFDGATAVLSICAAQFVPYEPVIELYENVVDGESVATGYAVLKADVEAGSAEKRSYTISTTSPEQKAFRIHAVAKCKLYDVPFAFATIESSDNGWRFLISELPPAEETTADADAAE